MDQSKTPELTPEMLAENPILLVSLSVLSLLFMVFVTGALSSWAFIGYRLWHKQPLLTREPWSPRAWGFADLVVAAVLLVTMQVMLGGIGVAVLNIDVERLRGGEDPPLSISAFVSASYLIAMILTVLWIMTRYQVGPAHLGLTSRRSLRNVAIGLVAGFAILPLIYLLSAVVNIGFETEYEHPILDTMRKDGTLASFMLAFFAAVIVAPFAEEMLFRVLIQGWLQSLPFASLAANLLGASQQRRGDPSDLAFYNPASDTLPRSEPSAVRELPGSQSPDGANTTDAASVGASPPTEAPDAQTAQSLESSLNARQPPSEFFGPAESSSAESGSKPQWYSHSEAPWPVRSSTPPIWPSILAGTLFGLAHWGYGLSFVPLIVLGIVLGLLYRATNSVWPCVIVHFMLNASSMLALGFNVLLEQAQP